MKLKKLLPVFMSPLFMLSAVACGGNGGGNSQSTASSSVSSGKKGSIDISMPLYGKSAVWNALKDEYRKINPNVTININDISADGYSDWLNQRLNAGTLKADIVIANQQYSYFSQDKFVDFQPYFRKVNPYSETKTAWKDTLDDSVLIPNYGAGTYLLNTDYIQVGWFYNIELFRKAKITVDGTTEGEIKIPETWDELLEDCAKLKQAGVSAPVALGGAAREFWTGSIAWLYMMYTDQYWRDYEDDFAIQPGDYGYDEELMGDWKLDMDDFNNDSAVQYTYNRARVLKMLQEGTIGPDTEKYKEMHQSIKRIVEYTPNTFFNLSSAECLSYFLSGDSAIVLQMGNYGQALEETFTEDTRFDYGFFYTPPMTGENVATNKVRSMGGPSGYYAVVNKNKSQNDLTMDFLMFMASGQGQEIRYRELIELKSAPEGTSLIKGMELPPEFGSLASVGFNGDAQNNPAIGAFSRGVMDSATTVREFQTNAQSYLRGNISLNEFSSNMRKVVSDETNMKAVLDALGYRSDALVNPALNPYK